MQEGGWRGRGAQAFYTEMNDVILPAVDRLAKALTEAHHAMSLIATRFQEAEQEAGALFTGVNGGKEGDGPSPKPTTTPPAQDGVSGAPNDSGSGNTRPNLAEQFAEFQRTRPDYSNNPRIDYYGTRITQREA